MLVKTNKINNCLGARQKTALKLSHVFLNLHQKPESLKAEEGFTNLTGIDYSQEGISLAKNISEQKGFQNINFMTGDILAGELPSSKYSIILDKGTYDAISLNPENTNAKRLAYKNSVKKLLQCSGLFIITSCNWTEEELKNHFESDFIVSSLIPSPKFQFGGKVGNSVTTIVFHNK